MPQFTTSTVIIQQTGALVRFLPPYSPDLNPIEEAFAKVKSFLKANELAYDVTSSPHLLGFVQCHLMTALAT